MSDRMHYAARRHAGKRVLGTLSALCGEGKSHAGNVIGHEALVTCQLCRRLLEHGRSFHVNGEPATRDEASRHQAALESVSAKIKLAGEMLRTMSNRDFLESFVADEQHSTEVAKMPSRKKRINS